MFINSITFFIPHTFSHLILIIVYFFPKVDMLLLNPYKHFFTFSNGFPLITLERSKSMHTFSIESIRELSMFSNLKEATISKIICKGHIYYYKAGEPLFFDRDLLSSIYFVLTGTVVLYKAHNTGQNKIIFMLSKGEILNESLSLNVPSAINCRAYHDCIILGIYKKDFTTLLKEDPTLVENILIAFSKRIHRLYRQLKNATYVIKMEKKLAAKLWKLSYDYGVPCERGILINFPITITTLADFLGSYRETTSRALKYLIENELVIYENKHIIVPDPDKLSLYFKSN